MSTDHKTDGTFATIPEAVDAFRRGEMLVVMDDERRENEGDIIIAAEKTTPAAINFMIKHAGGLICVPMARELLATLGISRMSPAGPRDSFKTAFMESVDACVGTTTGISAEDRARTVQALIDDRAKPSDLVRPGHVFPLEAVEGGVLRRPGHTEATVDLARLAGLKPAGVICEILREDGSMARRDDLLIYARKHGLKIITIEDLAVYRRNHETLVRREQTIRLPTDVATFQLHMYLSIPENEHHLALVLGDPASVPDPLVRIHSECLTGDVFGSQRCDCGTQLHRAMELVAKEGVGAILYLRQEGRGIGLAHKIHAYALQETGLDTVEANEKLGFEADLRDYSAAAQILRDLKLTGIRLLTNNPNKVSGLEKYGVRIAARVPLVIPSTAHNRSYLEAKKQKLGHIL